MYGLLDLEYRSSRALVILGFLLAIALALVSRFVRHFIQFRNFRIGRESIKKTVIVGEEEEATRTLEILRKSNAKIDFKGFLNLTNSTPFRNVIGRFEELSQIVRTKNIEQVIFCSKNLSVQEIMDEMSAISKVDFKIVPNNSMSIIGSTSKKIRGELYTMDLKFNLNEILHRRNKRILDILLSLIFIVGSPIFLFLQVRKSSFFLNLIRTLMGSRTLVSYDQRDPKLDKLPPLKKGLISVGNQEEVPEKDFEIIHKINLIYAKTYTFYKDLDILWNGFKHLGGKK